MCKMLGITDLKKLTFLHYFSAAKFSDNPQICLIKVIHRWPLRDDAN